MAIVIDVVLLGRESFQWRVGFFQFALKNIFDKHQLTEFVNLQIFS